MPGGQLEILGGGISTVKWICPAVFYDDSWQAGTQCVSPESGGSGKIFVFQAFSTFWQNHLELSLGVPFNFLRPEGGL